MCLRGEAPQTYFSNINLKFSNSLVLQFCSNFVVLFFQMKTWKESFSFEFVAFRSVKTWFLGSYPNFFHFFYFEQKPEIVEFHEFSTQIYAFFKWPQIRKYLSDRSEPKCGNGKEHFNFVFSWVKCQIVFYFACYSRELTYRSWLGTP